MVIRKSKFLEDVSGVGDSKGWEDPLYTQLRRFQSPTLGAGDDEFAIDD